MLKFVLIIGGRYMIMKRNSYSSSLECWSANKLKSNCWNDTIMPIESRGWPSGRQQSVINSYAVTFAWNFEDLFSFYWMPRI